MGAFGTEFAPTMGLVPWSAEGYGEPVLRPTGPLELHPAAHALHYGSACFEGLKAHRGEDGVVRLFRADRHAERLRQSAERLLLPPPPTDLVVGLIRDTVAANLAAVPEPPGSLYLRPVLLGTEPNIGAAAAPASEGVLYVLASPVGDYFAGGDRPLRVAVETGLPRTTPQFGMVKTGANYAMALGVTRTARARHGADQVLFAPGGDVQETGASNFVVLAPDRVVTRGLDASFLHGVTRDSILVLARDRGFAVEERDLSVDELVALAPDHEAALSGTAAVLAGVGELVVDGAVVTVGDGKVGEVTRQLRDALRAVQVGAAPDPHGWTDPVTP